MIVFFIVLVAVFAVDMVSKYVFTGEVFSLIPGFLSINYTRNPGIAFGWLPGSGVWVIALTSSLIIAAGIYYFLHRRDRHGLAFMSKKRKVVVFDLGFAFFIGGGLGNLVDRIFFGYVRDFLSLEFIDFPIFNFADMFITIGLILIFVYVLFMDKANVKAKAKE